MFELDFDLRDTNKYLCSSTQLDSSADEETKTTESTDGRGGSISLEEETTRMALLLGSLSKGVPQYRVRTIAPRDPRQQLREEGETLIKNRFPGNPAEGIRHVYLADYDVPTLPAVVDAFSHIINHLLCACFTCHTKLRWLEQGGELIPQD